MEIIRCFSFVILLCICVFYTFHCKVDETTRVIYDGTTLLINGQRRLLISGSIHYPGSTPEVCTAFGIILAMFLFIGSCTI